MNSYKHDKIDYEDNIDENFYDKKRHTNSSSHLYFNNNRSSKNSPTSYKPNLSYNSSNSKPINNSENLDFSYSEQCLLDDVFFNIK